MPNFVDTGVPIPLDKLKKHFEEKDTFYIIDYMHSELINEKFLTYLSNLEIPCDVIKIDDTLLETYLKSPVLVNIPSLEKAVIEMLLQKRGIVDFKSDKDYRGMVKGEVYDKVQDDLDKWEQKLESLRLYNMSVIEVQEYKDFAKGHENDDTKDMEGINFVSLLRHEEFYKFYDVEKKPVKWYSKYFEDYMFKGKNMFTYWAHEKNPMFLLTWGISAGYGNEYIEARTNELERMPHASSV